MRTTIRLLVALTLMAWGQLALAQDFYWITSSNKNPGPFPSSVAACKAMESSVTFNKSISYNTGGTQVTGTCTMCYFSNPKSCWGSTVIRKGKQCPAGTQLDSAGINCERTSDCSHTVGKEILKAQTCQYNTALKLAVCDDQIAFEGCKYTSGGKKSCVALLESGTYQCTGTFYGSGESNGEAPDSCSGDDCSQPRPDDPKSNCVSANGVETCIDPRNPGCGSVNGVEGCFQEKPGCGYFNGVYRCMEAEKPNRNCGYFNGKQVCYDPKDPTRQIPESSPDHPSNGGNADGNDSNDPLDPRVAAADGRNPQGAREGATNEAIDQLGDRIDQTNSLLGDIQGQLGQLLDGLFGEDFDGSGTGSDGDAEGAGKGAGDSLAGEIGKQTERILGEREAEVDTALKSLANKVANDWFGIDGSKVGLNNVLERMLPSAMGCTDYTIALRLDKYAANIVLPVCELTRLKPLLEYVIWIVTAVGLWRIFYAGLRRDDAKAARGGF
ncbi:hypothetical protein [Metapseudomonas furukawaii]|nr:hypothetical protein [Pseudomonas furukawaii]